MSELILWSSLLALKPKPNLETGETVKQANEKIDAELAEKNANKEVENEGGAKKKKKASKKKSSKKKKSKSKRKTSKKKKAKK